jgi:hypothetical protein
VARSDPKSLSEQRPASLGYDYADWRSQTLSLAPEDCGFDISRASHVVYGAVMDWGMGGVVATVAAREDGDASLFTSTGVQVTGGRHHESVRHAGAAFLAALEQCVSRMHPALADSPPRSGRTALHALTTRGHLVVDEATELLARGSGPLADAFAAGQGLIVSMRALAEK